MYQFYDMAKRDPNLMKASPYKGSAPNMPHGRVGNGIESFSALNNPRASPISNYYCKGYREVNDLDGRVFKKKHN